jgi:hypothetical protein
MPQYEYRFTSSTGLIQLVSTQEVADDSAAKASAQTVFATFLDFPTLESVSKVTKRVPDGARAG